MTRYRNLVGVRGPLPPPRTYRPGAKLKAQRIHQRHRIIAVTAAPIDAQYLTLAANGVLTDYRVLDVGNMLIAVDGGPAGNYQLNVDPSQIDHADLANLTTGNPHPQYLQGTLFAANGDLLTRVAGSPAALAIGTNGQVLTVAAGLPSWATPSGGAGSAFALAPISQQWYTAPSDDNNISTMSTAANTMYLVPFPVPQTTTYDAFGLEITASAAGNVHLGIYGPFTGSFASLPLVLDTGAVSVSSTGQKTQAISQSLTPGWYFLAALFSNSPTVRQIANSNALNVFGRTVRGTSIWDSRAIYSQAYGNLPSPSTTTPAFDNGGMPLLELRAA